MRGYGGGSRIRRPRPRTSGGAVHVVAGAWLAVALVLGGAAHPASAQTASTPAGDSSTPEPGFVTVEGRRLFVSCSGERSELPTVVFENGLGEGHATWRDVQPDISRHTRACAYDRLGAGRSDPVARDDTRTPFELAATLHALLTRLGEDEPVVLVGHSIAGFVLLAFAHMYPNDVAGLVFVDSSHPEQFVRFREVNPDAVDPIGVSGAERIDRGASRTELAEVGTFGDLPVVVLHQAAPTESPLRPIWIELQRDHAARSTRSRIVPATESGHYVHNDQPELVIDAIRWVFEWVFEQR